jgi:TPP-dependent pyruvate/acetoin dehydrogenase alpha subunit
MTDTKATFTGLDATILLEQFRVMCTIRAFEDQVHKYFALGEIPGFVHLYAGEEAIAAGVCAELRSDDYIGSTHRGHGHAIAKGCDVKMMMAEVFGRATGVCKGKGGSMHIADLDHGMLGANGIVGGGIPLATGAALSAKMRGTSDVAVAFMGEGATNEGTFGESLNLAAVWQAPCIYVVENNGYAESTGSAFALANTEPYKRAQAYGLPAEKVDGFDFFAVNAAAHAAVERARNGGGPSLIECKAARYYGHFEGDTQTYRPPEEVSQLRRDHDPLTVFRERVTSEGLVAAEDLDRVYDEVEVLVRESVTEARQAPHPKAADLLTDVYASY